MKHLFFVSFLFFNFSALADCPEAIKTVDLGLYNAQYMRVHPSGKYAVLSNCRTRDEYEKTISSVSPYVCLVDLTDLSKPRLIPTPYLNDEISAVEPTWELLASPNHQGLMQYFNFENIKNNPKQNQKPVYKDSFNEYYQSSSVLKKEGDGGTFRTMLWSGLRYQDYTVDSFSNPKSVKASSQHSACTNLLPSMTEYDRMSDLIKKAEALATAHNENFSPWQNRLPLPERDELYNLTTKMEGILEQPILSRTGHEIGGVYYGKTTFFKLKEDGTCSIARQLGFRTSKVNFSPPGDGNKATFVADAPGPSPLYIYDIDKDNLQTFPVPSTANYLSSPNLVEGGRVFVLGGNGEGMKLLIFDPKVQCTQNSSSIETEK